MDSRTNYYGSLCSELYDILHPEAPRDELEFYLSYAEKGIPFWKPCAAAADFSFLLRNGASPSRAWTTRAKCWKNCGAS